MRMESITSQRRFLIDLSSRRYDENGRWRDDYRLIIQIIRPTERTLLRRVMEICLTCETGKWNGNASLESIEVSTVSLSLPLRYSLPFRIRMMNVLLHLVKWKHLLVFPLLLDREQPLRREETQRVIRIRWGLFFNNKWQSKWKSFHWLS